MALTADWTPQQKSELKQVSKLNSSYPLRKPVIENPSTKEAKMASLGNSLKHLRRNNINSIQSLPENVKEGIFPIHFLRQTLL